MTLHRLVRGRESGRGPPLRHVVLENLHLRRPRGHALPIGLVLPGNACTLLTIPVAHLPIPVSGGTSCAGIAIFTLPIPSGTPSGTSLFAQWIDFDPSAYPAPTWLSATGGLQVTVL